MDDAEFTLPFEFRIYEDSSLAYMVDVCDGGRKSFVDNILICKAWDYYRQ